MTHVVAKPCDGCRYTDCVVVCPVECFYEGDTMLYIHPDECIDCEACVPECPVEAIYHEDDLPDEWKEFIQINADKSLESENITERKQPLADDKNKQAGDPDCESDYRLELEEILERLEDGQCDSISEEVYQRCKHDLCSSCYTEYRQNPLALEPQIPVTFSNN